MNEPTTIEVPEKEVKEVSETQKSPKQEDESIFSAKKHFPIFPTNLFEFELKEKELQTMYDCIPALLEEGLPGEPNWATRPNLNTLNQFKEAVSLCGEAALEILGFMGVRFDDMMITSMRGYRYTKPELGPLENRPNNMLSGIFFLRTDGKGRITFFDPRPQAWVIKPPISEANIFNSDAFSIEFKPGKMIVFPAWLQYQVAFQEQIEENIFLTWTAMVRGGGPSETKDDKKDDKKDS